MSRGWVVQGYAQAEASCWGVAPTRTSRLLAECLREEQVIAEPLNTKPKYVASRTLTEPLEWQNATLLTGDIAQAVLALKQEDGRDHVIGSLEFTQTLMEHDLVDEYRLMIDPPRAAANGFSATAARRSSSASEQRTSTGATLATYARSGRSIEPCDQRWRRLKVPRGRTGPGGIAGTHPSPLTLASDLGKRRSAQRSWNTLLCVLTATRPGLSSLVTKNLACLGRSARPDFTEVARRRSSQGQGRSWLVEAEPVGYRGRLAAGR